MKSLCNKSPLFQNPPSKMMSSKIILTVTPKKIKKRTQSPSSKSIKSLNRCRNRSPTKPDALASALTKSLRSCRRRVIKFFSSLARISTTPTSKSRRRRRSGYQSLHELTYRTKDSTFDFPIKALQFENPRKLPPQISLSKPTLVLDLDETLIHSTADFPPGRFDFVVRPRIGGEFVDFYVKKRPGLDEFLEKVAKEFEVVIFTAGLREYASLVVDKIDPKGLISHRLYRDACKEMEGGKFVKDLTELERDLGRILTVDDNPNAYFLQPENAVPVKAFVDDLEDVELERVWRLLERCCGENGVDLRVEVRRFLEEQVDEEGMMVKVEL